MCLFSYLFKRAKGRLVAALLAAFLSGLSSAALIGAISRQLTQQTPITLQLIATTQSLVYCHCDI